MELHFLAATAHETQQLGARFARALPPLGAAPAIVHLTGDLGAGKTTFARGFLRERGYMGHVRSPTFTLLECYELPDLAIVHVDLYRLHDPCELEQLGLRDMARAGYVWLIEWPERGAGHLPAADVTVTMRSGSDGHTVTANALSGLGEAWLDRMS